MNLEFLGYLYCYQGDDIRFSANPQDAAIPVAYYWQEPVYTESQVKEIVAKAGEVAITKARQACIDLGAKGIDYFNYTSFVAAIDELPTVTLNDLK